MDRLTFKTDIGVSIDKNEDCPTCSICWDCNIPPRNCNYINDALEKLAQYEELEEHGLLLKLPCKVGDKAWYVRNCVIDQVEVDSFIYDIKLLVNVSLYVGYERFRKTLTPYKTLFFYKRRCRTEVKRIKRII